MLAFRRYDDGSHSWLQVPLALLESYKIADKISGYSYYDNGTAYLEEDCDMGIFLDAHVALHGSLPMISVLHGSLAAFVRGLNGYNTRPRVLIDTALALPVKHSRMHSGRSQRSMADTPLFDRDMTGRLI